MHGAIAGDIAGSTYEGRSPPADFELFPKNASFTDDTVLTVAIADSLLGNGTFASALRAWGRKYADAGYGAMFARWLFADDAGPYGSFGNGSAMRVSPVGWAFQDLERVLAVARESASVTHDHPEGIRGAQAIAGSVFLARTGAGKDSIREWVSSTFGYDLNRTVDEIRPGYSFDETCAGSVPEAIVAYLESSDLESALRLAVSLGGDTDTLACMAGAIAHAEYGSIGDAVEWEIDRRLPEDLYAVLEAFSERYDVSS